VTVRFDSSGVDDAAGHLARRVETARALVAAAAGAEGGLVDQRLALAATALADLAGDAAELVALDLALLVRRLLDGARMLESAELDLVRRAGWSGTPR
jgi:hypothetical protein